MVAERDGVVGGKLEEGEVIRPLGDLRGDLDAGSTRADEPNPLVGEVDALVCQSAVSSRSPGKFSRPGVYGRFAANRAPKAAIGDEEARRQHGTGVRAHLTPLRLLVAGRCRYARL